LTSANRFVLIPSQLMYEVVQLAKGCERNVIGT
jgi:hypothetical protein